MASGGSRRPAQVGKRRSLSSGLGYGGLSFISNAFVALLSSVVIARLYGVEVVGQFALASAPVAVLWQLSSVKEQVAFVREISVYEARDSRITGLFWAIFSFSMALTAVAAVLIAVGIEFLYRGPVDHPELIGPAIISLGAYLAITNVGWNIDSVFSAFRAGRELNLVRLHQVLVFLILVTVGAQIEETVWILVAATAISQATALAHRLVYLPRYMALTAPRDELRAGFTHLPEFIRFGFKVVPGDIAAGISREIGVWVLSITQGIAAVGAYSRAWLLSTRLIDLNYRITEMLFPTLVERWQRGEREAFDRALADTLRYSAVVLLLPAAVLGGAAHGVMAIYGPEFTRASDALSLALLVPVLITLGSIQRTPLVVVGRPGIASTCSIAGLVVTAVTTVVAVDSIGLAGAALGALLGGIATLGAAVVLTSRVLASPAADLWPPARWLALTAAYAAGFAVAKAIERALPTIPGLLLALAVGTITYGATLWVTRGVTDADRRRLIYLRGQMKHRASPGT